MGQGQLYKSLKMLRDFHYFKTEVMVHKYLNESFSLFYGPMCLGKYDKEGQFLKGSSSIQESG